MNTNRRSFLTRLLLGISTLPVIRNTAWANSLQIQAARAASQTIDPDEMHELMELCEKPMAEVLAKYCDKDFQVLWIRSAQEPVSDGSISCGYFKVVARSGYQSSGAILPERRGPIKPPLVGYEGRSIDPNWLDKYKDVKLKGKGWVRGGFQTFEDGE